MVLTKIPGELIADNSIATADLADGAVTTAKIAANTVTAAKLSSGAAEQAATGLKSDIALLAFKTQANGNLAKYNLVDQSLDSFEDLNCISTWLLAISLIIFSISSDVYTCVPVMLMLLF